MAHGDPAAQPTFQGGKVGPACQRCPVPAWGSTVAIVGHASRAVKQRQMHLFVRQDGQKLAERAQNGQAGAPAIAVADAEQCGLPHHL